MVRPLPKSLYWVQEGRVKQCRKPQQECEHCHYYFLATAVRAALAERVKRYHITAEGLVELCESPACLHSPHFSRRSEAVSYHRNVHGQDFSGPWRPLESPYVSLLEEEVASVVEAMGYRAVRNTREVIGPYELDLYLPTRAVGVEVNGTFWHSEEEIRRRYGISPKAYHQKKFDLCEGQGITLAFVWEASWLQSEAAVVDALADLVQFRRHTALLEQFERALPPSDLTWEAVDREGMLAQRAKIEARLKKKWEVA